MFPLDLFYFKLRLKLQKGFMQICLFLPKLKMKYPAPAQINNESEDSNDTKQHKCFLCSTKKSKKQVHFDIPIFYHSTKKSKKQVHLDFSIFYHYK